MEMSAVLGWNVGLVFFRVGNGDGQLVQLGLSDETGSARSQMGLVHLGTLHFKNSGRSESALRQGLPAANACTRKARA